MQVISMVGYTEKYDFVINLAKTINLAGKSVLVIDGTYDKKLKFIIPTLNIDEKSYITQYDGIDFALGFESMHDLENYTGEQNINLSLYDFIIIDMDNPRAYEFFRTRGIDRTYFFMETSVLALNKNYEILKAMKVYNNSGERLKLNKIIYKSYLTRASEQFFNNKIASIDVEWLQPEYEIPNEDQDKMANVDAQISGLIEIKKHTRGFIQTIADLSAEIIGEETSSREIMKQIKRRR